MYIDEVMEFFTESSEQEIEIYSIGREETIFKGCYGDLDSEIGEYEIESIDNLSRSSCLVINIA